jgi:hypothetical protein
MFQVADDSGEVWQYSVLITGFQNPLTNGDAISLSSHSEGGGFAASIASLNVRDSSGELLFHVTESGDLAHLKMLDELSAEKGDTVCSSSDVCGSWEQYSLVVTLPGASVALPYLDAATLGPYRLSHGGFEHQTSSTTACADWFVARGAGCHRAD